MCIRDRSQSWYCYTSLGFTRRETCWTISRFRKVSLGWNVLYCRSPLRLGNTDSNLFIYFYSLIGFAKDNTAGKISENLRSNNETRKHPEKKLKKEKSNKLGWFNWEGLLIWQTDATVATFLSHCVSCYRTFAFILTKKCIFWLKQHSLKT